METIDVVTWKAISNIKAIKIKNFEKMPSVKK